MKYMWPVAVLVSIPCAMFAAGRVVPANVTVGQNLQTTASIMLTEATSDAMEITVTSGDPTQLLLSTAPNRAGSASIVVKLNAHQRGVPEFYVQGFGKSGTVTYTATAPGYESGTGTVTFAPSGFVIKGRSRLGMPKFITTTGAQKTKIVVFSAILDSSMKFVAEQEVAAGHSATLEVLSSNPKAGALAASRLTIAGGESSASTEFQPVGAGETILSVKSPQGFSTPADLATVAATVIVPAMSLGDEITIGENLQTIGVVVLAEPAPAGGLVVTLTSSDPKVLLLSETGAEAGTQTITVSMPPGSTSASYCLQALTNNGTATYTATAPGYTSRTQTVMFAPSGVIMGFNGPPDEAELFRKESADAPHGFVAPLSAGKTHVSLYTAQLDPINHRGADITVQALRPGVSFTVNMKSSDPSVGTITSPIKITGSRTVAEFTPLKVGRTVVSVSTPDGYTTPANATSLIVIVQ